MTVRFDTKIAIAVRADLQQWQKLNVTAFLASGIAASTGEDRAVVRAVPAAELDFAGLAVHGPRNAVDKIFKGANLHP